MTSSAKPILDPENKLNETFNINNFRHSGTYATLSDLLNYGNLYLPNNWAAINTFNALDVHLLNGIDATTLSYVKYLPNLMAETINLSYDELLNTTTIEANTQFIETGIQNNLNVGKNINVNSIVNNTLLNKSIVTNTLSCNNLTINENKFNDTCAYVYINGLTLPVSKSCIIDNFNIKDILSMYVTIKPGYRIDITDVNNEILFSVTGLNDWQYYNNCFYNNDMTNVNIYDSLNRQII